MKRIGWPIWLGGERTRSSVVLGIDLGQRATKVVALRAAGADRAEVVAWADGPTPLGVWVKGALAGPRLAAQALVDALAEARIPVAPAVLTLGVEEAATRRLRVPRAEPEGVVSALRAMSDQLRLPGGLAGARVDFQTLSDECDDADDRADDRLSVLAAAARPEAVRLRLRIALEAGLKVVGVVPAVVALSNAAALAHPGLRSRDTRALLVHVGYSGTLLSVVEGGVPLIPELFPPVGIADLLDRTRRRGVDPPADPVAERSWLAGQNGGVLPVGAVDDWVARLAEQARRLLGAVAEGDRIRGRAVAPSMSVLLSGGGATVPGLRERLEGALELPVRRFDPLMGEAEATGAGPACAVAYGLAADGLFPDSVAHLDLRVPLEVVGGGDLGRGLGHGAPELLRSSGFAVAVAVGVAALGTRWGLHRTVAGDLRAAESRLAAAHATADSLAAEREAVHELQNERARADSTAAAVAGLDVGRYAYPRLLDAVARATPSNVWVESITLDAHDAPSGRVEYTVRGWAPSVDLAAAVARRLAVAPGVEAAQLGRTRAARLLDQPVIHWEVLGSGYATDVADDPDPRPVPLGGTEPGGER